MPRTLVQVNKNTQLIVTPKLSSLISVMNHLVQGVEAPFFTPKSFWPREKGFTKVVQLVWRVTKIWILCLWTLVLMETFTAKVAMKAILEAIKVILTLLTGSEPNHSVESSGFFCHSDFYLKSILKVVEIQKCRFYNLLASECLIWGKFQPSKCVEMNKIQN